MKKRSKCINITKAILTRVIITTHMVFLYLSFLWHNGDFGLLSFSVIIGVVLICMEGLYTVIKRHGQDWKWGSPLLFIYIVSAYLPCLIDSTLREFLIEPESCLPVNLKNIVDDSSNSTDIIFDNPFNTKTVQNALMEIFFLIVVFTRWFLPKGKITLEELSKLLLIYMSMIADILDMMKMVRNLRYSNCDIKFKEQLLNMSLVSLSFSILQLCLGLTAKRKPKKSSNDPEIIKYSNVKKIKLSTIVNNENKITEEYEKNDEKCHVNPKLKLTKFYLRFINRLKQTFEKEVWGIVALLLAKDIPFSFIRTYALLAHPKNCNLWNQSIFFTLKNYFTIIIQINRCYVLFNLNEEQKNNLNENLNKTDDKSSNIKNFIIIPSTSYNSSSSTSSNVSTNSKFLLNPQLLKTLDDIENVNNTTNNKNNGNLKKRRYLSWFNNKISANKVNSKKDSSSLYSISRTDISTLSNGPTYF